MIEKYPKWFLFVRKKLLESFGKFFLPRWMVFFADILAVFLAFQLAYLLRFNFEISAFNPAVAVYHGLVVSFFFALFIVILRSYSGLIRRTTIKDISIVFLVTTLSSATFIFMTLLIRASKLEIIPQIPLSIVVIHYVTITAILICSRIFIKMIYIYLTSPLQTRKNLMIYGAGELGVIAKDIIHSDPGCGFIVKGFIDNDINLHKKKINGISVYGESVLSKDFLSKNKIDSLILAIKGLKVDEKSRIIRTAINLGIEVLETPEVGKWLCGQGSFQNFEKVKLEDLLGRDPIRLNMDMICEGLYDKTILVTGAEGSIGSEIVRQLARFKTRKVIILDQAETPLFYLGNEIREKFIDMKFKVIIADVTNIEIMNGIFREHLPDIVFHAAAYKHLSLMEEHPHEAVRVNVGGTRVITKLAMKYKVDKFVMISTDKSVNPTNVMGASKRICEKIVQSSSQIAGQNTKFIITRFGNVLGSNGSVIPLFSQQIQNGGPVTVTHPEVYRYFMTIPEACQLVLEAGLIGNGGDIHVFDMGEPVKIVDLATNMILLSGFIPGKDIQIVFTGLRPGEKLYEEMLTDKESTLPSHHEKIKIAKVEEVDGKRVLAYVDSLLGTLYKLSAQNVIGMMEELVPEYNCNNAKYKTMIKFKERIEAATSAPPPKRKAVI